MKIPLVLPTVNVSGDVPHARIPPEAFLATGALAAEGLGKAAEDIGAAIRKRRLLDSEAEASDLSTQIELAARQQDINLRRSSTDPDEYLKGVTQGFEATRDQILRQAKQPYTEQILRQKLPVVQRGLLDRATAHADQMRTDAAGARLDRTTANVFTLQALTPYDDEQEQARLWSQIAGAAQDATPYIGEKRAQDFVLAQRKTFVEGVARQHVDANPADFIARASEYAILGSKELENLRTEAQTKIKTAAHEADLEAEKLEKRVAHKEEEYRRAAVDQLESQARDRSLTLGRLEEFRLARIVTGEDYRRIREEIERPKDQPSDPATLQDLSIRVHRVNPQTDEATLDAARRAGKLSFTDWKELKDKLIGRVESLRSQGETDVTKRQNQAEQVLQRGLGISSLYDKIDEQDKQLFDLGLRELTARSQAFGGREEPVAVANDILNRMAPLRQERLKLKAQDLGRSLMFPAPTADEAGRRLETERARLAPTVYDNQRRLILDMKRAEVTAGVKAAEQRRDSGAKPTGAAPKPPSSRPTEIGTNNE